jgi:hypothetical protein
VLQAATGGDMRRVHLDSGHLARRPFFFDFMMVSKANVELFWKIKLLIFVTLGPGPISTLTQLARMHPETLEEVLGFLSFDVLCIV